MRNLYKTLLCLLLISYTTRLNAQVTITLDSITGKDITSSQIIIDTVPTKNMLLPHLYIINNTGLTENWLITRKNISQPDGWFNYLCWGGVCYSVNLADKWSSGSTAIGSLQSEDLTIYVDASTGGNAHYRYYVSSDGISFLDSVDIVVNVTATVSIEETEKDRILLFPNPAQSRMSLTSFSSLSYDLVIYDNTGNPVIVKEDATSSKIDVSGLTNGSYLFIMKDKKTLKSIKKKVIIAK